MSDHGDTVSSGTADVRSTSPLGEPYHGRFVVEFDPTAPPDLTALIVNAVADAKDRRPSDLGERLYERIDPDVVRMLVESGSRRFHGSDGVQQLSFTLCGMEVCVRTDGELILYDVR